MFNSFVNLRGFQYLYSVEITSNKPFTDQRFLLQEAYDTLVKEHQKLQFDYQYLQQQLSELKRMIFGSKSERFISSDTGQLDLFVEQVEISNTEPTSIEISYKREEAVKEKQQPVRSDLPSHLPRIEEIIEPDDVISGATKTGEEITEISEYNPSSIYVRKIVCLKYILPKNQKIVIGSLPSFPIPKGNTGAGLLAHIMVSKFVHHLPFYKQ